MIIISEKRKRGRPTEANKNHDIKVRVDDNLHQEIVEYCEKNNMTKAEMIRKAIVDFLRL